LRRVFACVGAGDEDRDRALATVKQQRRDGRRFGAGAQDIGCADIARADIAQIAEAECFGDEHPEGHRAKEIAEYGPRQKRGKGMGNLGHQSLR